MTSDASKPAHFITENGAVVQLGGGAVGFTQDDAADATDAGGTWDVRAMYGSRSYVAGELAYVGSAQDIDEIGVSDEATLVSNGLEADIRLNLPIGDLDAEKALLVEPFAFAGVGWQHFDIVDASPGDEAASIFEDNDSTFTVPLGAGVSLGYKGLWLDTRFTVRPAFDSEVNTIDNDEADTALSHIAFTGSIGAEF
jgi:hypothetical protein